MTIPTPPSSSPRKEYEEAASVSEASSSASTARIGLLPPVSSPKLRSPARSKSTRARTVKLSVAACAVVGLTMGLFAPLALPAYAADAGKASAAAKLEVKVKSQSFKAPATALKPLTRDAFAATTPEELAAMKAAKAAEEAARQAQVEAAAAAAAAVASAQQAAVAESATGTFTVAPPRAAQALPGPRQVGRSAGSGFTTMPPNTSYNGDAVVAYAEQFVGKVPYGMGNNPNDSFSCDGLTQYVFGQFGISLPRTVTAQATRGTKVSPADAKAGDLVIWPGEHVGIYDGKGGVIHSPDYGRMVTHGKTLWGTTYYFMRVNG